MINFKQLLVDDIKLKCPMIHHDDGGLYSDTSWSNGLLIKEDQND